MFLAVIILLHVKNGLSTAIIVSGEYVHITQPFKFLNKLN